MFVILKNGDKKEIEDKSSALDLANSIGISKKSVVAMINGKLMDLSTELHNDDNVSIITMNDKEEVLPIIRHSAAHILAMALREFDHNIKFAIGPTIENGFYYDVKSDVKNFSVEDFSKIEEIMRDIIESALPFERIEIPSDEAIKYFSEKHEDYKVEIINDLNTDMVTLYKIHGNNKYEDFIDLCRGPHIPNTSFMPKDGFKLMNVAGAYWRGDSSKDMLQRIYAVAFLSKKDLNDYTKMIEEAQARDHRKLGVELELFHIDEEASGSVFWLKNGTVLFNTVKDFVFSVIKKYGYFLVQTPTMLNKSLWETSGHWDKFRENMFIVNDGDDKTMAIKPMNCPGHLTIYKNGPVKSYRDLPIRMAEFGLCHRNEPSGSLHGLMRVRAFTQDDAHVFCRKDQIVSETQNICSALKEIYSAFGFNDIHVKFSDRPEKRAGSDEVWDIAEKSLMEAADASGLKYTINKGEGAFYGPKLEFVLKDCLGRDWQCGTLQVDFVLPERFDISYIDNEGNKQRPVMLHRALVGSLERFIGILIENYAGKFPFWLAPVQIAIASITDESSKYASELFEILENKGFRAVLDIDNQKINYKIREHSLKKIPYIIVVGKKEAENKTVSLRKLGHNDTVNMSIDEMIKIFDELMINRQ